MINLQLLKMGWSEMEGRCKKHPKHKQSPGVCSFCLRERLSQLSSSSSSTSNTKFSVSCSSSHSSLSSLSGSGSSSPPYFSSVLASATKGLFGRSRSMAVFTRHGEGGVVVEDKKKKGRFWLKLLRPGHRRRKEEEFLHSKTMKEVPTYWTMLK